MSILNIKFQWYTRGIKNIKPNGLISLKQFINATISPKPELLEAFKLIQEAGARGDKEEKDRLKTERLFFTTPSAIFDPIRNYDSIKTFLPLAIFEYDNIDHAEELRDYIFEKRKDCIFAYMSPSKKGCKFIFLIPTPTSIEDYKQLWYGIAHDLDKFQGLDFSNARLSQPLFISYDPDAKFREDAVTVGKRGYKVDSFVEFDGEIEIPENVSEEEQEKVYKHIEFLIDSIEEEAHNNLLKRGFTIGGGIAYYGLDYDRVWSIVEGSILIHDYIKTNQNGYLKTVREMINKGINFPKDIVYGKA